MTRAGIVTMMKDEAPFLLHWIAYHREIGFSDIHVFTNDCSDGTDALLDRLAQMGEVTRHDNPVPEGGKPQPLALRRAEAVEGLWDSDWLVVMDVDEYLRVKVGDGRLASLLDSVPQADGFALTWRMMGGAGQIKWSDAPVPDLYLGGAPDLFRRGWGVKTLFRPFEGVRLGIHRPTMRGSDKSALSGRQWVNGSGKAMPPQFLERGWRSSLASLGYGLAEIAHYATQSHEAYLKRDARGNVNAKVGKYDATYYAMFDRNEVTMRALPHGDAVRARVAGYLADAALAQLHADAMGWHAEVLAALRAAPDYAAQIEALVRASNVAFEDLGDLLFVQPLAPAGRKLVARLSAQGMAPQAIARIVAEHVNRAEAARDTAEAQTLLALGVVPDHGDWG